jgi:hypothetical protein
MKYYSSTVIVCPFYHQETALRIHCDGINSHSSTQVSFDERLHKDIHERKFCKDIHNHPSCPIYKAIVEQFEEETK